ncbi:MAG: hypothetical protein H7Y88_02745 [Phycisphaerales bacterium]|nr:hypothetical protein [Phycisphaerales bacterium]
MLAVALLGCIAVALVWAGHFVLTTRPKQVVLRTPAQQAVARILAATRDDARFDDVIVQASNESGGLVIYGELEIIDDEQLLRKLVDREAPDLPVQWTVRSRS